MKSLFEKKDLRSLKTRLRSLREKISSLEETKQLEEEQIPTKDNFGVEEQSNEDNIVEEVEIRPKKIADKKTELKEHILQTIRKENLTGGEVKQKIVDQARLCSKASFYRYIQELKKEGKIESLSINNQDFLYSKE